MQTAYNPKKKIFLKIGKQNQIKHHLTYRGTRLRITQTSLQKTYKQEDSGVKYLTAENNGNTKLNFRI